MIGDDDRGSGRFVLSVSHPRPDTVVVHVAGALDLATVPAVRETVISHLDSTQLVLDLGRVGFFSGSAAQLLLDLRDDAAGRGCVLHLVEPADRHVRHVLDLTGLAARTLLHATVEDALQHVEATDATRADPADVDPADVDPASSTPAIRRAAALAGEVARLAGEIGETEDVIAARRERMAQERPHRAAQLEEHVGRARRFAEHERGEEERWQRVHDAHPSNDDPDQVR